MSDATTHLFDLVAQDLEDWLLQMTDELVEGLQYKGRSPFSADVSEREKLSYYRQVMFNPDGTPNEQGRASLMQRVGTEGFIAIAEALMKEDRPGIPEPESYGSI